MQQNLQRLASPKHLTDKTSYKFVSPSSKLCKQKPSPLTESTSPKKLSIIDATLKKQLIPQTATQTTKKLVKQSNPMVSSSLKTQSKKQSQPVNKQIEITLNYSEYSSMLAEKGTHHHNKNANINNSNINNYDATMMILDESCFDNNSQIIMKSQGVKIYQQQQEDEGENEEEEKQDRSEKCKVFNRKSLIIADEQQLLLNQLEYNDNDTNDAPKSMPYLPQFIQKDHPKTCSTKQIKQIHTPKPINPIKTQNFLISLQSRLCFRKHNTQMPQSASTIPHSTKSIMNNNNSQQKSNQNNINININININQKDNRKLQLVCIDCCQLVCDYCVIFGNQKGEKHNVHRICSIVQFISDYQYIQKWVYNMEQSNNNGQQLKSVLSIKQNQMFNMSKSQSPPPIIPSITHNKNHKTEIKSQSLLRQSLHQNQNQLQQQFSQIFTKIITHKNRLKQQLHNYYTLLQNKLKDKKKYCINKWKKMKNQGNSTNINGNLNVNVNDVIKIIYNKNNLYHQDLVTIVSKLDNGSQQKQIVNQCNIEISLNHSYQQIEQFMKNAVYLKISKNQSNQISSQSQQQMSKTKLRSDKNINMYETPVKKNHTVTKQKQLTDEVHEYQENQFIVGFGFNKQTQQTKDKKSSKTKETIEGGSKDIFRTQKSRTMLSKVKSVDNLKAIESKTSSKLNKSPQSKFNKLSQTSSKQLFSQSFSVILPQLSLKSQQFAIPSLQISPLTLPSYIPQYLHKPLQSHLNTYLYSPSSSAYPKTLNLSNIIQQPQHLLPVFQYVTTVIPKKSLKFIRLADNNITDQSFISVIKYLSSLNNINLENNLLTEKFIDILISNRDRLAPLRIVNVKGNRIIQEKVKGKGRNNRDVVQEKIMNLGKIGIIVNY